MRFSQKQNNLEVCRLATRILKATGQILFTASETISIPGIISLPAIGATAGFGSLLINPIEASSTTTVQYPPWIRFTGAAWTGAISHAVDWAIGIIPASSGTVTSALYFRSSVNGSAFVSKLAVDSGGSGTLYAPATIADLGSGGIGFSISYTNTLNLSAGAIAIPGKLTFTIQALSGAGAVNVTTTTTALTSTGALQALTLADGTNGQIKIIVHTVDGGSSVLTPTTKTGFSTVTFTNAGESVMLQFFTTVGWIVISSYGAVVAP